MPFRDGDETVTFQDVQVIDTRPLTPPLDEKGNPIKRPDGSLPSTQEKSVRCRFEDGTERFVSRSQVPSWQTFPDDATPFELEVSAWMVDKWEEGDRAPREVVKIADVVVLGSYPKSIRVRLPDGEEASVPLTGVDKDSPVRSDGDRGELWLAPWCAKLKDWTGTQDAGGRQGNLPATSQHGVGADARGGFDDSDDVPF